MSDGRLPFDDDVDTPEARIEARDRAGRTRAVDPRVNVVLEASAGTGKTRVLVDRYLNLLKEGVDPFNILAMTFTRKAAAEMRERILARLHAAAERGEIPPSRWRTLRERTADITISTIDAFCLGLLREFPLEADLDPGFSMADDTDVPRLMDEALDRTLRVCRALAREDERLALVFAKLGDRRVRRALIDLLNRRVTAPAVLARFLAGAPSNLDVGQVAARGARALLDTFSPGTGGLARFLATGPVADERREFALLAGTLRALEADAGDPDPSLVQLAFARARDYLLTRDGRPRARIRHRRDQFASPAHFAAHRDLIVGFGPALVEASLAYARDLNVLVARGVARMYRVAEDEYRRTLDAHAVLDFSDVLVRTVALLKEMEEFSQSRFRLESRYHHVLLDEFQDTSRAQWELVSLLVQAWGAGAGLAHTGPLPPSIFIVGDRKQSIYGFRDADVSVLRDARAHVEGLRPEGDVHRVISRSHRSVAGLLAFVNDVCQDIEKSPSRRDGFLYAEEDRFPVAGAAASPDAAGPLALVLAPTPEACAEQTADEIARLVQAGTTVRDRDTGVPRPVRPGDIAILFRTRESHREFEHALETRGLPSYVYKGLGFFDADEIKDVLALLQYLADPWSPRRAAALLRSRFARISDESLRRLAPWLAEALVPGHPVLERLTDADDVRALGLLAPRVAGWLAMVDRLPPAELLDLILQESAYAVELCGPRCQQAQENLKKMRALVRRMQNRGYATFGRIAAHLDRLAAGDEANATIDALDSVNLMTVHASKGLEFPVVFLVNLGRGTGRGRSPVRVSDSGSDGAPTVAVGDFESPSDEDDRAREVEESKRLLYVALTRARDRLYLGAVTRDGEVPPAPGSLAEVLPASLREALGTGSADLVEWRATGGGVHRFRRLTVAGVATAPPVPAAADRATDFGPLVVDAGTAQPEGEPPPDGADVGFFTAGAQGAESERWLGTAVHGLLRRFGLSPAMSADELAGYLLADTRTLLEMGHVPEREVLVERATDTYRRLCGRADVRALMARGQPWHEVPIAAPREGGPPRRGSIDLLIHATDGTLMVVEFKTGRPRPDHAEQVEFYRAAVSNVFPGAPVEVHLIYDTPGSPPS
ncbi:MAG: UvrD-helicase domain-containing protein [Vicinamibacterales bacterium]